MAANGSSTDLASTKLGCLFGVGVGPGDPELLTLKALRVIQEAPVICVPQADTQQDSYALEIVRKFLDLKKQELVRLVFPTDDPTGAAAVWQDAAHQMAERLQLGQDVAFITEGDPMLYSTFYYVLDNICSSHPASQVEIVPGVSSVMAAAASGCIPLATQGQRIAVLPAVYGIDDLSEAIASYDTVVLMKVNRTLMQALGHLESLGLTSKATYIRRASTPTERVVRDLGQLSDEDMDYFSLLIIRR